MHSKENVTGYQTASVCTYIEKIMSTYFLHIQHSTTHLIVTHTSLFRYFFFSKFYFYLKNVPHKSFYRCVVQLREELLKDRQCNQLQLLYYARLMDSRVVDIKGPNPPSKHYSYHLLYKLQKKKIRKRYVKRKASFDLASRYRKNIFLSEL